METEEFVSTVSGVDVSDPRGPWMQVNSGGRFYPLDPRPEEVNIRDIAKSLSKMVRFNGHTDRFYSVAEHSVHVSRLCREKRLSALLHDATEAYVGDMIRPLKYAMPAFREVEKGVWKAVASHFDIEEDLGEEIHRADNLMCAREKLDIFSNSEQWENFPRDSELRGCPNVYGLSPKDAEDLFMNMYFLYKSKGFS